MKTIEKASKDLNRIQEEGVAEGWLNASSQLHLLKVVKSLQFIQRGASKTLAQVRADMPVLESIRAKVKQ